MSRRKSYGVWVRQFKPVQNHVSPNSAYDGTMFETYGADLDYVLSLARSEDENDRNRVWTLIDTGGRDLDITNGYHIVNRLGYFITETPFTGPGDFMNVVG